MKISRLRCGYEKASGLVTNDSASTVQVFIDVQFLDGKGVILDDGIAAVRGLRPGESAEWEAPYLGEKTAFECRAQVSSAFSR